MNFKPKLVAFDLDGTLAESKQRVTPQIGELLSKLLAVMPVAVLSGGSWRQFESQLLPALPEQTHKERLYLMPVSAAQCYVFEHDIWKTRYDNSFGTAEKSRILQALKEVLEEVKFEQPPRLYGEQIEDRGAQITWSANGQQAPLDVKVKWDPDRRKRLPIREALMRRVPDISVGVNATNSIDITHKGINKAYGIRKLIEFTQISISEMLYVGDALQEGGNDAVVKDTGIHTYEVIGPEETAQLIQTIIAGAPHLR